MLKILFLFIFTLLSCNEIPQSGIIDLNRDLDDIDSTQDLSIRPQDQIFLQSNFCACKKGKPVTVSANCETRCQGQSTLDSRTLLYLKVSVGAELENSQFKDLEGWCNQNYFDPQTGENLEEGVNPACQLIVTNKDDPSEELVLPIEDGQISGNSINALNLTGVRENVRYIFKINEQASGVDSDSKDLRIYQGLVDTLLDSPLWIDPIYQYACLSSSTTTDNNSNATYIENTEKIHFYYSADQRPDPNISSALSNIQCHTTSSPTNSTPLIDQTPGQIKLWNKNDIRFADFIDPDTGAVLQGELYIDRILKQLIEEYSGLLVSTPKLFSKVEYFTNPVKATNSEVSLLGYMLLPFKDAQTQQWYCPKQEHYFAANPDPVMLGLREMIKEDTQGLYIAKQQNSENDFIYVLEEDVARAWFYLDANGQEVEPTPSTIRGKKLQFYWPISSNSPRQKKPHQVIYTIQVPSNAVNPANLPQDNRIGCAPKI